MCLDDAHYYFVARHRFKIIYRIKFFLIIVLNYEKNFYYTKYSNDSKFFLITETDYYRSVRLLQFDIT